MPHSFLRVRLWYLCYGLWYVIDLCISCIYLTLICKNWILIIKKLEAIYLISMPLIFSKSGSCEVLWCFLFHMHKFILFSCIFWSYHIITGDVPHNLKCMLYANIKTMHLFYWEYILHSNKKGNNIRHHRWK